MWYLKSEDLDELVTRRTCISSERNGRQIVVGRNPRQNDYYNGLLSRNELPHHLMRISITRCQHHSKVLVDQILSWESTPLRGCIKDILRKKEDAVQRAFEVSSPASSYFTNNELSP